MYVVNGVLNAMRVTVTCTGCSTLWNVDAVRGLAVSELNQCAGGFARGLYIQHYGTSSSLYIPRDAF